MSNFLKKRDGGQVVITVATLFLMLSLTMILGMSGPVFRSQRVVADLISSKQSYYLAEAGTEDVVYRISHGMPYSTSGQTLSIDGQTVTINTETVSGRKIVTATGDWNDSQRSIQARLVAGEGVAFYYGVQIGQGGFTIGNNSGINGSVYSNGSITGSNGSYITGTAVAVGNITNVDVGTSTTSDAWATGITSINVTGNLYCQTGTGNNKSCNLTKGVPPSVGYPLTEEEINGWKADASAGGTTVGNVTISSNTTLGPRKIEGNLIVNAFTTLTVTGTIYVTGSITLGNDAGVRLSSGYGESGGIVMSDGTITFNNNVTLAGSGTSGSYLMMMTNSNSSSAISIGNGNTTEVILYAQNGTIQMGNNANVRSLTANTIALGNNTVLNYTQGLLDAVFNSGPSGGYQIDGWKDVK